MEQVLVPLPGAVASYSAKSALFTAGLADRGTFFDNTGSYTISFAAAATLGAGWSCWVRCVSGTQTLDPNSTELINGASTYAVSNAGDIVLVECTGTAFVVSHTQRPSTVAITGGSISGLSTFAVAATTKTPAQFVRTDDGDLHVKLQSGSSADQRAYFAWYTYNGVAESWLMGKNGSSEFILFDADNTTHRMHLLPGGATRICSSGTAAVAINNYGEAATGTGGFEVYSGGASPAVCFSTTASTTTVATGNFTVTSGNATLTAPSGNHIMSVSGSATSSAATPLVLRHSSSGTPTAGFGVGYSFQAKSDTTGGRDQALMQTSWVVATDASRTARLRIFVSDTSSREVIRGEASGTAAMIGFLGASAVIRQTSGEDLTNNVTSGGTDGTIANYTDLSTYGTDAAAIRNNIYQLARKVKQVNDALRDYGLLT